MTEAVATFRRLSRERIGQLLELNFCFLLLPMIVWAKDPGPYTVGGRILLWGGVFFLIRMLPEEARFRLRSKLREGSEGWIVPIGVTFAVATLLGLALQTLGHWRPPQQLAESGLEGALLALPFQIALFVLPKELLFRAYFPIRFQSLFSGWRVYLFTPVSGLLFAWIHLPAMTLSLFYVAFAGGLALSLLERMGVGFRASLILHGICAWLLLVTGMTSEILSH